MLKNYSFTTLTTILYAKSCSLLLQHCLIVFSGCSQRVERSEMEKGGRSGRVGCAIFFTAMLIFFQHSFSKCLAFIMLFFLAFLLIFQDFEHFCAHILFIFQAQSFVRAIFKAFFISGRGMFLKSESAQ